MAATNRKPLTFNVSLDTYNRFAELFPHAKEEGRAECSEQNLISILQAFEQPNSEPNSELSSELSSENSELRLRVQQLEEENTRLSSENSDYLARVTEIESSEPNSELSSENSELRLRVQQLEEENARLSSENSDYLARVTEIESSELNSENSELSSELDPFTAELLNLVTERLREKTDTPTLTPMQVLLDGFLKYNIQQYNLWFYDFVVRKSEILTLANKHNPEIDSYKKLLKALGIYD